jgi:phenylalanine-4-hydroxylase
MAQEATLYSPVIKSEGGNVCVIFAKGHPGFDDPAYQEHRNRIAQAALGYVPGQPVPDIEYTEGEHELWRLIAPELREKHQQYACGEFLRGVGSLDLPTRRLPQLNEVSVRLQRLTGFCFTPAAGLVEMRQFYQSLAEPRFQATQYIRHSSMPRFSPEPDMVHEIIGHGSALANSRLASLYRLFGQTASRLRSWEAVSVVSRVFWFTMEYGLVREDGEIRVLGASLLSSCGEIEQFRDAQIMPLDLAVMARQDYEVETYQQVLFCADSFEHLSRFLTGVLTSDEQVIRDAAALPPLDEALAAGPGPRR